MLDQCPEQAPGTFIQRCRMRQALRFVPTNARVIDIGAQEGELFTALGKALERGFGIEPLRPTKLEAVNFTVVPFFFPRYCRRKRMERDHDACRA